MRILCYVWGIDMSERYRVLLCTEYYTKLEKEIKKTLQEHGLRVDFPRDGIDPSKYDFILIIGTDGTVLRVLHKLEFPESPILTVNVLEDGGFLTSITTRELNTVIDRLLERDYRVEPLQVISASIDGKIEIKALNEIAIFPSKSATLMEYELFVNEEFIWRDHGDGIITATPIGSTAYSLSAGGPLVLPTVEALILTPVNSLDPSRRPLIISNNSTITIRAIHSSSRVEAIADGIDRINVNEEVIIYTLEERRVNMITFDRVLGIRSRLYKKIKLAEELLKMPPSAKLVYKILEYEGPLTQKEIADKSMLPLRTVRYAISMLSKNGLVARMPDARDSRRHVYFISAHRD